MGGHDLAQNDDSKNPAGILPVMKSFFVKNFRVEKTDAVVSREKAHAMLLF